jgi:hypothetical protein
MFGWLGCVDIYVVCGTDAVKLFCFGGRAGIPDGGGGGSLFRSLAGWPAAVDLFSSLTSHKWSADVLSMLMMRFGVATERWLLRLNQCLMTLVRGGGGVRTVAGCSLLHDFEFTNMFEALCSVVFVLTFMFLSFQS